MANTAITTATVSGSVQFLQPNGNTLSPNAFSFTQLASLTFASGVGILACDRACYMQISIVASGTQALDLDEGTYTDGTNAGTIVDENNIAVVFVRVKAIMLQLVDQASGPTQIHINPAATHALTTLGGKCKAKGDGTNASPGFLLWADGTAAGEAVVADVTDIISVVNDSAAAGKFNIAILGASA